MQAEGFRVLRELEAKHWWFRSRRDLIREQARKATDGLPHHGGRPRILDFGCGTGYNLQLFSEFGAVWGADRFRPEYEPFRLEHGFPLLDTEHDLADYAGRFDLVTALDVLEHIDDDVEALRAMVRLLAPTGQLLLTVPAYPWLWSNEDVIGEHRRRYTRASLQQAIAAAGLRVRFLSYFNLSILPAMASVIGARRLLAKPESKSRMAIPPLWLNEALYELTKREAKLVGSERLQLPAGGSLVCRLERAD